MLSNNKIAYQSYNPRETTHKMADEIANITIIQSKILSVNMETDPRTGDIATFPISWFRNRSLIKNFLSSIHSNLEAVCVPANHDNFRVPLIKMYMRNYIPVITLICDGRAVLRGGRGVTQKKRERAVVNRHPFASTIIISITGAKDTDSKE